MQNIKIRIGILTYHRAYNYGAYLQACALCNRLNEEDSFNAEIIDYHMKLEKKYYDPKMYPIIKKGKRIIKGDLFKLIERRNAFERAIYDPVMRKTKKYLISDNLEEFHEFVKDKFDIIVVGSDEVWKVSNFRKFPNPYWLIGDLGCKKFSYAVSARVDFEKVLSKSDLMILKDAINDFDFISVRDDKTKIEIEVLRATKLPIHKCCDPSFLYDFDISHIHAIEKINGINPRKDTVIVIVQKEIIADKIRKDLRYKYNLVALYYFHKGYINVPDVTPMEWLSIIRDASFVISSLFHAACFSIVQKTPFLSVEERESSDSKLEELLNSRDLKRRYIGDWSRIENFDSLISGLYTCDGFENYVSEKRESFSLFLDELRKIK